MSSDKGTENALRGGGSKLPWIPPRFEGKKPWRKPRIIRLEFGMAVTDTGPNIDPSGESNLYRPAS